MSIPTLLHECWTRGITLSANGDQLAFRAPPGALDDALKDRLREHKTAILAELAGQAETGQTDYFAPRPLGANERSLWFLYRMAPTSCAYNLAYAARLQPGVTAATVERAFTALQQRHPILCSPYGERDGDAMQWLDTGHPPRPLDRRSFSGESEQDIRVYLAREADRPLALESGEVCRALLASNAREDGDQHYLLLVVHHIAADFASFEQLLAEFVDLAGGESAAEPGNPDTSGYRAWVAEQSRVIRDEGEEHGDYWRQQLEDAPGLELPTDFPHPAQQTFEGEELSFTLPSSDSLRLREAARSLGVTPYIYWLALFQWFLGRLSGQRDFVIGTPSSGRLTPELHALVGYLVNPVPLRCRLDDDLTLADWVRRVQRQATEALGYQAYPFATLVEQLQLGRETGRAPVFQHMFTLNRERSLPGRERVIARELMAEQRGAAHELNLVVVDRDDGFLGKWRYNRALYRRTTVAQLRELFLDLVRRSVNNLDQPLADLQWLPEALAGQLTGPRTQWPQPGAWEAFVHQVRTRPDALAIHELPPSGEGEQQLSYGELAARVNGCGRALQDRGLAVGDRVALCLPRGLPWVTALLATWQQGASYVALDPKWPAARLAWTCEDASPRLVVGLGERPDWLPPSVQWLDATAGWRAQPGELVARTDPSAPAYVIYTSGSTGRPKGVVVSQGSLLQYSQAVMERLQLPGDASLASLAGVATDLGYTALFGALLTGRTLRLLDEDLAFDAEGLADQLEQAPVDCLKLVPSHLKALLIASRPARLLPRRCLVCGGEALTRELVDQARSLVAELRIVNHYGPTEATVGAITYEVPNPAPETLPIGQPLANVTASVRNPRGELLPRGISGELYLAGATLAEGYLNRSEMTAKAFVRSERGEVLYRTGDRVSIDRNGQLRFIGRVDHQVKIRGYRVEPGEVANTVKAQPGVRDAVVVNRPDSRGQNRLVAYLVCDEAALAPVREALAAILPDYMVPAVWIPLPGLPLKDNGKVDSSALPDPDQQEPAEATDDAGDAREDGVVGTLLAITRELLGNDSISATDNFFAVGGDSILSLQIIARAKQQGLQLTPKQIFEHQTMAALAQVVERTGESPVASAEPDVPQDGPFALTPIQQWVFEQDQPRPLEPVPAAAPARATAGRLAAGGGGPAAAAPRQPETVFRAGGGSVAAALRPLPASHGRAGLRGGSGHARHGEPASLAGGDGPGPGAAVPAGVLPRQRPSAVHRPPPGGGRGVLADPYPRPRRPVSGRPRKPATAAARRRQFPGLVPSAAAAGGAAGPERAAGLLAATARGTAGITGEGQPLCRQPHPQRHPRCRDHHAAAGRMPRGLQHSGPGPAAGGTGAGDRPLARPGSGHHRTGEPRALRRILGAGHQPDPGLVHQSLPPGRAGVQCGRGGRGVCQGGIAVGAGAGRWLRPAALSPGPGLAPGGADHLQLPGPVRPLGRGIPPVPGGGMGLSRRPGAGKPPHPLAGRQCPGAGWLSEGGVALCAGGARRAHGARARRGVYP